MTVAAKAKRTRRRAVDLLLWVGGATFAVWVMCFGALWIYAGPAHRPVAHDLVIPHGTAAMIREGKDALQLPSDWGFRSGDVLRIVNDDVALHKVGLWSVVPGSVKEVVLKATPAGGYFGCSVHTSGRLTIEVEPRRTDWTLTLLPTALIGPILGALFYVIRRVAHRLNDEPTTMRELTPCAP